MSDTNPVSGVSGRYATALFDLAQETGQLDLVEGHVAALSAALSDSADLRALVSSPLFRRDDQAAAMAALCKAMGVVAPTSSLVGLMAAKGRLFALGDVLRGFDALLARHRGIVPAEVRSARPLSGAQRAALEAALAEAAGAKIALAVAVDPSLIGGLVVKLGSRMIDSSIRSKLAKVQTAMKEAGI